MVHIYSLLLSLYATSHLNVDVDTMPHPIYIGLIEIEHQPNAEIATILVKVFSDDLMNCVRSESGYEDLTTESQLCQEYPFLVNSYFEDHFEITFEDQVADMDMKACNQITDSHWLEYTMDCPKVWTDVNIKADFFMEIFATQNNMITIRDKGRRTFYRTKKGRSEFIAKLSESE